MAKLFESMVKLGNGTDACGFTAKSDGVTSVLEGNSLVTYGGPVADKVWLLDLTKLQWAQQQCTGYVPAPRTYHTAVTYGQHMLVYGGVVEAGGDPDETPYYELDLECFDWMKVQCFGETPGQRSHHTAVVHNGMMLVMGGQEGGAATGGAVTNGAIIDAQMRGFYDLFMLDIASRTWSKVELLRNVPTPMLWGHTAVMFNQFMLVYGGFDVRPEEESRGVVTAAPDAPPSCTINDLVYVLNVNDWIWNTSSPHPDRPSPVPRTLHTAVLAGTDMLVFGGLSFDTTGRAVNINDAWLWDVPTGRWTQIEFCIPYWPSKRLLCTVHRKKLIVCRDLVSIHVLDFDHKDAGWASYPTDPTLLFQASDSGGGALWDPEAAAPSEAGQDPSTSLGRLATTHLTSSGGPIADADPAPWHGGGAPRPATQSMLDLPGVGRVDTAHSLVSHVPEPLRGSRAGTPTPPLQPMPPPPSRPPSYYPPPAHDTAVQAPGSGYLEDKVCQTPSTQYQSPHAQQQPPGGHVVTHRPQGPMVVVQGQAAPSAEDAAHQEALARQHMMMQQSMQLQEAEKQRQQTAIRRLQAEMEGLQSELAGLTAQRDKLTYNTVGASSPTRPAENVPADIPITSQATAQQYNQINALRDYLGRLQMHQQSVLVEQRRRHDMHLDDLSATHKDQLNRMQDNAQRNKLSQGALDAIAKGADIGKEMAEQMGSIKDMYDKMLTLQQQAPRVPLPENDATMPEAAGAMGDIVATLKQIPAYTPGQADAAPTFGTGLAAPARAPKVPPGPPPAVLPPPPRGHDPAALRPVTQPNLPIPIAPLPSNLPERKAHHLEALQAQLQRIEGETGTAQPPYMPPAPATLRGTSVASSTPGAYWDRLKDLMGEGYVGVGEGPGTRQTASPAPRGPSAAPAMPPGFVQSADGTRRPGCSPPRPQADPALGRQLTI